MNNRTALFLSIRLVCITVVFALITAFSCASAQNVSPGDDYDVLVIPVAPSVSAPGRDLMSSDSLEARGLQLLPVQDYELGSYELEPDRIIFTLKPNQAIQLFSYASDVVPVSATSVYFSVVASASGEPLNQAALALLDANDPYQQSVAISFKEDVPYASRDFSLEYRRTSPGSVYLLVQLVGPEQGESQLVLERMRLLDGYRELDVSLGAVAVTSLEDFRDGIDSLIINPIAGMEQGYIDVSSFNHLPFPDAEPQSLILGTKSPDEVIQILVPLELIPEAMNEEYPRRFYGTASIRRISGEEGTFSVALASGATTSVGYENHPIGDLSTDAWKDVQCPIQFSEKGVSFTDEGVSQLLLIVQLQGGPAEIAVDDVSIQARRNSMYLWDSSLFPGLSENN